MEFTYSQSRKLQKFVKSSKSAKPNKLKLFNNNLDVTQIPSRVLLFSVKGYDLTTSAVVLDIQTDVILKRKKSKIKSSQLQFKRIFEVETCQLCRHNG